MTFYQRRLPHLYATGQAVFLTWRLHGSLSPNRAFPVGNLNCSQHMDCLPIQPNATVLEHDRLWALVVMPNHVHLLVTLLAHPQKVTQSLKGITAKRANVRLALTGCPVWQEESYDHLVRHEREFLKIRSSIEEHPVGAGLVATPSEFRWSSAGWATGGSPAECAQHGQNLIG